jgi:hypothetical protein
MTMYMTTYETGIMNGGWCPFMPLSLTVDKLARLLSDHNPTWSDQADGIYSILDQFTIFMVLNLDVTIIHYVTI